MSGRHGTTGKNSATGTGYDVTAEKMSPTGTPCTTYVHPVGSRDVKEGDTGHDVVFIQRTIGTQHMGVADGTAGSQFVKGVEWWQTEHHLTADGIVGPKTYATMGVKES